MRKKPILKIVRTSLRLNRPLYDKLSKAATLHGLSMHAEITRRLNASVEMEGTDQPESIRPSNKTIQISKRLAAKTTEAVIAALIEQGWQPPER